MNSVLGDPTPSLRELPCGYVIDKYTIDEQLGRGNFATVYSGSDDNERKVAIKIGDSLDQTNHDRIRSEAAALKRLKHPGIPAYVAEGSIIGHPYIVMDLAPGRSLHDRILNHLSCNQRFSDVSVLRVIRELFEILVYLNSEPHISNDGSGWVHRDIKDANVVLNDSKSRVTLIDFGFCKESGDTNKRFDDSFFHAGAARFAPPTKLDRPAHADPTYDVFAVGVLAYLMLTNQHPWSVPYTDDVGDLIMAMRSEEPIPISELNNTVRPQVCELIEALLTIDDKNRPSATEALETVEGLLSSVAADSEKGRSHAYWRKEKLVRVWRDALYGDIRLTEYEMRIIDSPEMQRLRYIKQLGFTSLVFSSADHSRLSHSVGCVHRVEQILRAIEDIEGRRFDAESRSVARLYGLVHDVTHIAYGHTLEDELGFYQRHDENVPRIRRLVLHEESRLGQLLQENENGRIVSSHFDPGATVHNRSEIFELATGMVGADLLDYIDRDSHFLGLDHKVDSAVFRQFRLDKKRSSDSRVVSLLRGGYGLRIDRIYAIESVMVERYALFLKAYTHRTKAKASALLGKALALGTHRGKNPILLEKDIEWKTDDTLINFLASSRRDAIKRIATQLHRRELPVAVYRGQLLREGERNLQAHNNLKVQLEDIGLCEPKSRLDIESELASVARDLKADQVYVYATPNAPGLKRTQKHRFVERVGHSPSQGSSEWFNRLMERHMGLWDLWVFVDSDADERDRDRVAAAAADRFDFANHLKTDEQQGRLL